MIPVYQALLENKTAMGIPTQIWIFIGIFTVLLFVFLRTFLVVIPSGLIFVFCRIASHKDANFLYIFFKNLEEPKWLGV